MKSQRQVWALVMESGVAEPLCEWRGRGPALPEERSALFKLDGQGVLRKAKIVY